MSYILIVSLGPVQDFIAAARKTRDLWFGSQMLSDAATVAARTLQDAGAQLIFPAPDGLDGNGAPNKIVAIVDGDPRILAEQAVAAAQGRLRSCRERARQEAQRRGVDRLIDWQLLDAQLDAFLEHYAAWYPFDPARPDTYSTARRGAERLLAGRKALRDFAPAAGYDGVPKSSLDPSRETVVRIPSGAERDRTAQQLVRADIKLGELLDGVSLVKRLADPRRFVSVSRIAVDPLIRRLDEQGRLAGLRREAATLMEARSPLIQQFTAERFPQYAPFPFDTQLFFSDGSDEKELDDAEREHAAAFNRSFRALLSRGEEPPVYLAVLAADGDRMGAAIDNLHRLEDHRALSAAGAAFADRAESIVARNAGALVYSGGDDVLAFLPLDTALQCAGQLHDAFAEAMSPLPLDPRPTLSVGISIGYYSEPLSNLLAWARAAEAHAKGTRDALAVALHTRSGGSDTALVRHGWKQNPLTTWERWIEWYVEDIVPDGAAYELRELARELRALAQAGEAARVAQMLKPEVERILARKKGLRGSRSLVQGDIDWIVSHLKPVKVEGTDVAAAPDDPVARLEDLVTTMIVARHFARARRSAGALIGAAHA